MRSNTNEVEMAVGSVWEMRMLPLLYTIEPDSFWDCIEIEDVRWGYFEHPVLRYHILLSVL